MLINAQSYEKGGIQAQRGFLSQTYSLLFYLLARFYNHPDLEVVIESSEGEDAKFTYLISDGDEPLKIVELIQSKKRESSHSSDIHAGAMQGDEWTEGKITLDDLSDWIEKKRPKRSVSDLMSDDAHLYYTAIVFGELANKVSKFIPEGLRAASVFRWPSTKFSEDFPIDYQHKQDPVQGRSFATQGIRRRIRILRMSSPSELGVQCELLLRQLYNVSSRKSAEIVQKLRIEIENRGVANGEENRRLLPRDINVIIAQGQSKQGYWQEAQKFLEQNEPARADVNRREPPRWIDFVGGSYVHRKEFDVAWAALEREGRIVISGPAGTGKTTLCRFLAFRFLSQNSARQVYYLPVAPIESLQDEIEFLKAQIYSETLFIVDDQHHARDEVETLIQTFMDYQQEGRTRAWLIVTSNITFPRALSPVGGRRGSELSQTSSIRLLPVNEDEMERILQLLNANGLHLPLPADVIASASEGNIGLALILASCAKDLRLSHSRRRLFDSKAVGRTLTDWILKRLGRDGDYRFFAQEVAPVFIIGSYGISIPEDFTSMVRPLCDAGFLELVEDQRGGVPIFRPVTLRLAFIIDRQHNTQRVEAAKDYFDQYPKQLSILCERLTSYDYNLPTLEELFKICSGDFVKTINDRVEPLRLVEVSKILRSVYEAARPEGIKLLRSIAAPLGQPDVRFLSNFLRLERCKDIHSLEDFFDVTYRIDRYLMRRLADEQLGWTETEFVLGLCKLNDSRLDEIATLLHAISKHSRQFAIQVYEALTQSPDFIAKIELADKDPRGLSIWVRFCEEIRTLNRSKCYRYMEAHLPSDKILRSILSNPDLNAISRLLLRLRRINPRLASEIFSTLWQDHRATLERLLLNENQLDALRAYLNALSRINRRLTIRFTSSILKHLRALVGIESRYRQVGSTILFLHSRTSMTIARTALESIDKQRVLLSMQQEDRAWDLIGKNLYDYAQISPDVAAWFEEHLSYTGVLQIHIFRLQNLVHVIRGFLVAARPERKAALLQTFMNDNTLLEELKHGWNDANNLTEIAFGLSLLRDIPLAKPQIFTLLGIPNLAVFQERFLGKFMNERSIFHIANGLFGIAKFDLNIADEALRMYVEKISAEAQSIESKEDKGSSHSRQKKVRRLPRGYEPNNLVDIGCLLQVAAAIEPASALQLAMLLDFNGFSVYAADETNLGRLTVFITGLHNTSYKLAREFVQSISSQEIWERQFVENEEMENVLHYARSLSHISRSRGSEYIRFVFENHLDEIQSFLGVEANLMLVSNWLRILRVCGTDFIQQHTGSISPLLLPASEFDTRLRSLLEATEASMECGFSAQARQLAAQAIEERNQMRSIRRLHDWIVLLHKSLRIGRELQMPDFPRHLFSSFEGRHLALIIEFEGQALLPAYTYYLLKRFEANGLEKFRDAVTALHWNILTAAREERHSLYKVLALIFADASIEEIKAALNNLDWRQPWEIGLVSLIFTNRFPNQTFPFTPQGISQSEWQNILQQKLHEHANNLEFGLTLHLLAISGFSQGLEKYQTASLERAKDEMIGAIGWLLRQRPGEIYLGQLEHYIWIIIRETALRSTYLIWEREIENAVSGATFKQTYTRDLSIILRAYL
jgi:conflict system STAND superfamily ATPase